MTRPKLREHNPTPEQRKSIMMYVSPQTFARLQVHAEPLVDRPDAVINKVLNMLEVAVAELAKPE